MTALSAEFPLVNRNILLAVTGSIAACKSDRIISELQDRGANVQVLLTSAGRRFFPEATAGSLTEDPVLSDQFDDGAPGDMVHIDVKRKHDLVLVAPATANRLLQMESPEASDTLGTVLQAFEGPVMYAPAMNPDMWDKPRLQQAIERNSKKVISPDPGLMACGDEGMGRLKEPEIIAEMVTKKLWPSPLEGSEWVISAGPTREPWDSIRFLSNRSSGRMGESIARIGSLLGGDMTLVTGSEQRYYPNPGYERREITTTEELREEILELIENCSGYIGAAAVSDYRPVAQQGKIRSGQDDMNIELEKNPDILKELSNRHGDKVLVGFSADSDSDPTEALKKAQQKDLQAVIFNSIQQENGGFNSSRNEVCFCLPDGEVTVVGSREKNSVALQLWLWLRNVGLV